MISEALFNRYYADPKFDGTIQFYDWIRGAVKPTDRVLNLGAGPATGTPKRRLKGAVAEVVGADIDPLVLQNDELDRAYLIENGRVPLEDNHFDVIYADWVLEHVEQPTQFLVEVHRLLKPRGIFFFRTPNTYHYVALVSRFTPHSFHTWVANPVRGLGRDTHDPWPTRYRMNSSAALKSLAERATFSAVELRHIECQPSYLMFHPIPFFAGLAYERLVNSTSALQGLRATILGRFDKG